MKRSAGQPTKYSQDIQSRADAYLSGEHKSAGDAVPSIVGLARYLGVSRPTLINWRDAHSKFFTTFNSIVEEQERLLITGGLTSEMNSTIVKLMMANHGYSDRILQDNTSSDGSMTPRAFDPSKMSTAWLQELLEKANDSDDNSD